MIYYGANDYRDYLAHHGVMGQRKGHRHGPPYPLSAGAASPAMKKAGWKPSEFATGESKSKKNSRGRSKRKNPDFLKDTDSLNKKVQGLINGYLEFDEDPEEALKKDSFFADSPNKRKYFSEYVTRGDRLTEDDRKKLSDTMKKDDKDVDPSELKEPRSGHGIPGQHWGVQNRGSGRYPWGKGNDDDSSKGLSLNDRRQLKELSGLDFDGDPFDKAYDEMERHKQNAKDFRQKADTFKMGSVADGKKHVFASRSQTELKNDERIKKAHEELAGARKEYENAHKMARDFNNLSEKEKDKYIRKASDNAWETYGGDSSGISRDEMFRQYKYGDLDQGADNSFSYYCKAKGSSIDKEMDKSYKAGEKYKKEASKKVDELVGAYGNKKLSRNPFVKSDTVRDAVNEALEGLLDDERFSKKYYIHQ